jgi:hypothetical protein
MSDISQAITAILKKQTAAGRFTDYYDGNHNLAYATKNYNNVFGDVLKNSRENLCPIVVDAPADRMEIINFSSNGSKTRQPIDVKAWAIWQREMMELESFNVHRNAFKTGDAFLLLWRAPDEGKAVFYIQDSAKCAVIYDEETARPLYGAKMWALDDRRLRLTLYYADRFEKYITTDSHQPGAGDLKAESFTDYVSDTEEALTANPFGVMPMFHFSVEPVLANAIPVQDRLNKTICDELVAQEFGAYPQRYATGLEPPTNEITGEKQIPFKAGLDRLWVSGEPTVKFGQFAAADLTQFLSVEDAARLSMARVTGTPLHFFSFTSSNVLSGEALKTLESRFTKRVKRTCLGFGAVWSNVMKFALQIEGEQIPGSLTAQWNAPEQRSEKELVETLILKRAIGVPNNVLQEELGYTEEDISNFSNRETDLTAAVNNALAVQ